MTRTFSKADWEAAQAQWRSGDFSPEWRNFRHQAAMRGMIYPPEGSKWDSWEDDEPSQRALLIRAVRDTPSLLSEAIGRSRTWGEVIAYVLRRRDMWREELDEKERRARLNRPVHREAMQSLASILQRIEDSL